jgi:hypothetical protein
MEDLLPDRGTGPALYPCDRLPVDPVEEKTGKDGNDEIFDHVSIL